VFVDGAGVGDIGPSVVRERETLARDGFVLINLTLDGENFNLVKEPEIITRGFIYKRNGENLLSATRDLVTNSLERGDAYTPKDLEQIVKSFLFNKTRRRPMVFVTMSTA